MNNMNPIYWISMTAKDLETKYISRQAFDELQAELQQAREALREIAEMEPGISGNTLQTVRHIAKMVSIARKALYRPEQDEK